jgi:RNA polymerase sigma-70 factor (sigma-E family)
VETTDMGTRASHREGSRGASPPVDQDAIEELYLRHAPAMVRLAYLLTHDGALAEDLVQDAFVKVVGRMGHLRSMGAFDAYLRKAVVNRCLSHHRRASVERRHLEREGSALRRPGAGAVEEPDLGTRDELLGILAELPERQRAVVVLRYYEDLSEQQVAQTMGCSVTAARSLLFRAMATIRTRVGEHDEDREEERR